ncbi:MAG: hypothetical protein ABEJ31_07480 [Haloarculaceae archaeon]
MGFSVSGSFALLTIATVLALGGFYATTANVVERVTGATQAQQTHLRAAQETAIAVGNVTANPTCGVRFNVTNVGDRRLSLNDTDLLVDGVYRTGWQAGATVDGDAATDLWLPGQRLSINVTTGLDAARDRLKLVTGPGVARIAYVTGGSSC